MILQTQTRIRAGGSFTERKSCSCRTIMVVQSAHMIEGKCIVHTFKNYTKLENVGAEDYFCRFEYKAATGGFTLDRVAFSDKEEPDAETITSMLGFQSYWDATYADELANFREHGHAGEVWLLDSNQLSGNIPLTLGLVLNLEALNLLSGSVPPNLNNLVNVRELFLSNNQLSGSLTNLTGMATLNYMSISNNSFNESDVTA
ncbi:hypothetical protein ACSBR1_020089 [Camellia fascicularis]